MYGNPVIVSTYVIVQGNCSIDFSILGSGQVEVTCGSPRDGFQFVMATEALRKFLQLGGQALTEMDALSEHEDAEREAEGRCELTAAGERSA